MPQKNIYTRAIWSQAFDDETVNPNEELQAWNNADLLLTIIVLVYVAACQIICGMNYE
jgi:hypothetical protein